MRKLIARCLEGERDAIEQLTRWYRPRALDMAKALLQDEHLAEDIVQEALLAALAHLHQLRNPDAFYPWFRQILRTQCTRYLRKNKEQPDECLDNFQAKTVNPQEVVEKEERRKLLKEAVASLPIKTRQTTELFYFEEMACRDLAGHLKVPVGTVKRRLHDSRQQLKVLLGALPIAKKGQRKKTRLKTGLPL